MYSRVPDLILPLLLASWLAACTAASASTTVVPSPSPDLVLTPTFPADARTADAASDVTTNVTTDVTTDAVAAVTADPLVPLPVGDVPREFQRGDASWYGPRFHGRRTASGERYDMRGFTAAHRSLPFGTMVRVRSLVDGREVVVRITDRGPSNEGRVIDLSRAAAQALGMLGLGVKDVLLLVPNSIQ